MDDRSRALIEAGIALSSELSLDLHDTACVIAGLRADLGSKPDLVRLLTRIREDLGGIPVAPRNSLLPPGLRD